MLIVKQEFFGNIGLPLKYINIWDRLFSPTSNSGILNFYSGPPEFCVVVVLPAKRSNLKVDDIKILIGDHNDKDIENTIKIEKDSIFDICKLANQGEFILDLYEMRILSDIHFKELVPEHGLSTFFMFSDKPGYYHCIVTKNLGPAFKEVDLFSWLLSYIYSSHYATIPIPQQTWFSKMLMQGLAGFYFFRGDKKLVNISDSASILSPELADTGGITIPGTMDIKVDRFNTLLSKARNEYEGALRKRSKKDEFKNRKR